MPLEINLAVLAVKRMVLQFQVVFLYFWGSARYVRKGRSAKKYAFVRGKGVKMADFERTYFMDGPMQSANSERPHATRNKLACTFIYLITRTYIFTYGTYIIRPNKKYICFIALAATVDFL
jgi:hypothetical protein